MMTESFNHSMLNNPMQLAEIERLQFSCDLHDGLLQYLIGAKLNTEALKHQLPKLTADEVSLRVEGIEKLLQRAVQESRQWIGVLRGESEIGALSVRDLIARVVQDFRDHFPDAMLTTDLDPAALRHELPEGTRIAIYRIAQESLRNASRHGKAKRIHLSISLEEGSRPWQLEVKDDGAGFDVETIPPDHFGIVGMRTRAMLIDAILEVDSKPGVGTTVRLAV